MAGYTVVRSGTIDAPTHAVHALVDDFHSWVDWSPWEDLDPDLHRTYTGPERGVGAVYSWTGNRKAGAGRMEITRSAPEGIEIALEFLKPFKATNTMTFTFTPSGNGTTVHWQLSGQQKGLMSLVGRFYSMDKMIGPDFEKGIGRLKRVAERGD